jgi:cell wall-associated NlpC family hydrolase
VAVALVLALPGTAIAATQGEQIVAAAASQAGLPYCFDGGTISGPSHGTGGAGCGGSTVGFDCTGLTLYAVYQATGKVLSHDGHQAMTLIHITEPTRPY